VRFLYHAIAANEKPKVVTGNRNSRQDIYTESLPPAILNAGTLLSATVQM